MLLFYNNMSTLVKVLRIVGSSFYPLTCLQKMQNRHGGTKFGLDRGRDRGRCSEIDLLFHTPVCLFFHSCAYKK